MFHPDVVKDKVVPPSSGQFYLSGRFGLSCLLYQLRWLLFSSHKVLETRQRRDIGDSAAYVEAVAAFETRAALEPHR